MAVPALLLTVDGQPDVKIGLVHPFVDNFLVIHKVIGTSGTVNNIYLAVIFSVSTDIVDDRAQRRKADTAGHKKQILAPKV